MCWEDIEMSRTYPVSEGGETDREYGKQRRLVKGEQNLNKKSHDIYIYIYIYIYTYIYIS